MAAALGLVACSPEDSGSAPAKADTHPGPSMPTDGSDGRAYRHTSLAECEVVHEELDEMPYIESLCDGPAGWALRVTDADGRENLIVVRPGGREASLELSRIGGGGFSSIGPTAEWRGPAAEPFAPESLIVRYRVAENPYPEPERSYLLAIDLAPRPCVVARIAPGPAQNAVARDRADDPGSCLQD